MKLLSWLVYFVYLVLVFNLISISHLTKCLFCCFVFISNLCFIQDLTHWSMIGLGKEYGGLYLLQQDFKSDMFKSVVSSAHTCPFNAWRYCLGHPSNEKLALLNKVLPVVNSNKDDLRMIGPIAKKKRLPFIPVLMFLMLVLNSYTDLWGLLRSYHWCFQILSYNCGWLFEMYLGILA